jgi:probable HAF family extracellular repeat protein
MNTSIRFGCALAALAFSILVGNGWAQVYYRFTDLGTLPGDGSSEAFGINSSGQVVGYSEASSGSACSAFLYANGTMHNLGNAGWGNSYAFGINDSGQVVGTFRNAANGYNQGFLYSNSTMTPIGPFSGGPDTWAFGINGSGQIVGYSVSSQTPAEAFLYSNGTVTALGAGTAATAINDSGQVAGYTSAFVPFLYSNGTESNVPTPTLGTANAINDAGQVAGQDDAGAFVWSSAAGIKDLGTLPAPYNLASEALGINRAGQVVGTVSTGAVTGFEPPVYRAFVYTNGRMLDLNSVTSAPGWTLEEATAINASGQIAGYGTNSAGQFAFLLTPLEPGDANGDGRVDINDLSMVLADFGKAGMTWSQGDFTGDGTVDINDLTLVLANFNTSYSSAGIKAVPEPSCIALLGIGAINLLLAIAYRKRRPA